MIGFELTEEQKATQTLAREFVNKEIKPIVPEFDRQPDYRDRVRWDIVDKLSEVGFRTMNLDKKYGGPGADLLTVAIVLEELAAGDPGVAFIPEQTMRSIQTLQLLGTEEQRQRFLIPLRDDSRFLIARASTESEFGSDHTLAYPNPIVNTTAIIDGHEWVINGTKQWSLGGAYAKLLIVLARTKEGLSTFLVPSDTPGVKVSHIHDEIAGRLCPRAEITFDNVRIPRENILETREQRDPRSSIRLASLVYPSSCIIGVGRAAYEAALEYARTRVQGGKRIIEHQAIGMMLADMFTQLEAARLLNWKVAWTVDHCEYGDPKLAAMNKAFAAEVVMKITIQALQIHGGYGGTQDFSAERHVRNAAFFQPASGTEQVLKIKTARFIDRGW